MRRNRNAVCAVAEIYKGPQHHHLSDWYGIPTLFGTRRHHQGHAGMVQTHAPLGRNVTFHLTTDRNWHRHPHSSETSDGNKRTSSQCCCCCKLATRQRTSTDSAESTILTSGPKTLAIRRHLLKRRCTQTHQISKLLLNSRVRRTPHEQSHHRFEKKPIANLRATQNPRATRW